jgi:glycosyltransferase involved in cell wall biosynthesis
MKERQITLIGPNPDETQGGGVRTRTLLGAIGPIGTRTNCVFYSFHKKSFDFRREHSEGKVSVVAIDFPSAWPPFLKIFSLLFIFIYTWQLTRRSRLILCTFGSMLFAIPPVLVSRLRGTPIILDYIDTEIYGVPESICRYFIRKAAVVFAISLYLRDQAVRYGANKVLYIPTFVDTDFFQQDPLGRLYYRETLGLEAVNIAIAYAGSLAPFEGLPFLLEAFRRLATRYANIKLVVVGKRLLPTDCDIANLAANLGIGRDVHLQAPVAREEYPKLLSAFDILCVPRTDCAMSRAANPIKVTEYMSMGLPVVCSSVGEIARIITDGVNGYLTKPSDPDDLEKALERVILNRDVARAVGENARKEVIEKYHVDLIGERIRQSLSEFADRDCK